MRCWLKMDAGNFHLKRWWKSFMMEVLVIKLNYITHTAQQNKNLTFNWCRINLKYTAYYLACSSYDRITDCNMNHLQIQWMTEGICVPAKPARDFAHHFDIFMSINGAQFNFAHHFCAHQFQSKLLAFVSSQPKREYHLKLDIRTSGRTRIHIASR